jgi:hypothetical protein
MAPNLDPYMDSHPLLSVYGKRKVLKGAKMQTIVGLLITLQQTGKQLPA